MWSIVRGQSSSGQSSGRQSSAYLFLQIVIWSHSAIVSMTMNMHVDHLIVSYESLYTYIDLMTVSDYSELFKCISDKLFINEHLYGQWVKRLPSCQANSRLERLWPNQIVRFREFSWLWLGTWITTVFHFKTFFRMKLPGHSPTLEKKLRLHFPFGRDNSRLREWHWMQFY